MKEVDNMPPQRRAVFVMSRLQGCLMMDSL